LFVEVGDGVEGLLHSSQLPIGASIDDGKFAAGEEIEGWVREVDRGRNRLSLTLREVPEGDPWNGVTVRLEEGSVVEGLVEQSSRFGFFVTLEPGLTGLLPFSAVSAPNGRRREDAYRAGQQINVTIMDLDPRRKRISLGLEGAKGEGSKADLHAYKKRQDQDSGSLNAIAAAFEKLNLGG
jgi:small subunit ribosomal protein S1